MLFIELCGSEFTLLGFDVVKSLELSTETSLLELLDESCVSESEPLVLDVVKLSEISKEIVLLVFEKLTLLDKSEELPPSSSLFSLQAVRQTAARTSIIIEIIFFIHSTPLYKPLQALYDRLSLPHRLRLPQKSPR